MGELVYNPGHFLTSIPYIDGNPNLREPQKIAYAKAYEHFIEKKKDTHAIIILPTGVGKTGLIGLIPYGIARGRVLVITPQIVIKDTVIGSLDPEFPGNFWLTQKVFDKIEDLPCLVEYEGNDTKEEWLRVANMVVVNIQKLQGRLQSSLINRVPPDYFDMIIIDEAHHSAALTWMETIQYFSNAKVVKLTGTPFRSDGKKLVGEVIYEYKLSAAMANQLVKSLEKFFYIPDQLLMTIDGDEDKEYTVDEIRNMGLRDEDWINRSVAYSKDCSEKVVVESIKKLENKLANNNPIPHKIIAVACSIKHAEDIKELYEKYGYPAAIIHSEMDKSSKKNALLFIENHKVKVVINVAMLGEGYDHPYLSVAAIFRPFRHLLPYAQFIGRVLRAIPNEDGPLASDNIAQIICHRDLGLDDLWEYYKKEIQESETIKYLAALNLKEYVDGTEDPVTRNIDKSLGVAKEKGTGILVGDTYIDTKLIELRKKEQEEELRKIQGIQELLGISAEEAKRVLQQATASTSSIKRPDLYIKRKRSGIDARINEDIIPSLLQKFNLDKTGNELKDSRLFRTHYHWIAQKFGDKGNAALLAVYINVALKDMIGLKREDWTPEDWDIAEKKLDQLEEYLTKVLEELTGTV